MKTIRKLVVAAISISIAFNLAGCAIEPKFASQTPAFEDDYEKFFDFDIRELEEQIPGYWSYVEQNEEEQKRVIREVEMWDTDWIIGGNHLVGRDIAEGLYIVWKGSSGGDIWIEQQDESGEMQKKFYWEYSYTEVSYLYLAEGEYVRLPHDYKMALADSCSPSPAAEKNGVYYEGSYLVGEDIPEGEYFAIDIGSMENLTMDREDYRPLPRTRFVYFTLSNTKILNIRNFIVFPADHKPRISPIRYQGTGEGEGSLVYSNGMYKIGEDLPVGTYKIKNEVYHPIYDLSYEGYHGNASWYYPGNWCGLEIHSSADKDRKKTSLDREIELDNRVNETLRSVRVERHMLDGSEIAREADISYEYFWGLPTITFTDADIGTYVSVELCILIPEE